VIEEKSYGWVVLFCILSLDETFPALINWSRPS
jgi:hypothetical protein